MKRIILILTVAIMAFACSGVKVISDFDKTVDFTEHKTLQYYGWEDNSDSILNRFDKERIENAFADEFGKRGISVVEGNADIIVSLFVVTEQKTQKSATTNHFGGGYGGYYGYGPDYGWGSAHSSTTYHEYEYTEGTLIVSVYDAKEKVLIWESVGSGVVDENPKNADEKVAYVVAKIMGDYPLQAQI